MLNSVLLEGAIVRKPRGRSSSFFINSDGLRVKVTPTERLRDSSKALKERQGVRLVGRLKLGYILAEHIELAGGNHENSTD